MYSIGIKIPKWNGGQLLLVDDFVRTCAEAVIVTDLVFTTRKNWINHILWIRMLRVVFMNSKTHMVLIEVVSQNLDEYKNNGLISKLHEILLGQIWACCLVWYLINHGLMLRLWNWYGIY